VGERTSYPPGTFCWVDLAAADPDAAKRFYGELFGWAMEDLDAGGRTYTICRLDGASVAGFFEMTPQMRAQAPPFWSSHVAVADADTAAARARELGATVLDEPVDVGPVGRMAVVRDPRGAVLSLWQPRARPGAERVNDVGCLCMNELATDDPEAVAGFYAGLFGWTTELLPEGRGGAPLRLAFNDGAMNAAILDAENGARPHWRPCFTVESCERALERIGALGGRTFAEPLSLEDGTVAVALDPGGAVFAIYDGSTDP
jgi:uncharacterized protein